tara:strand:+ start:188 stop:352 length:165 start_codon:yes stop_codon:yes gene_type:complete
MEDKAQLTNQNYRKMMVKNAFEVMKSNQREYSKQSNLYVPMSLQVKHDKNPIKK